MLSELTLPNPTLIPLSIPTMAGNEWKYLKECIDTNWVSYLGPFVDKFEEALAVHAGVPHAVAMSSGTAALHIALLLAGVEAEAEVVMPGLTFVAPANAVRYVGAWPILIDLNDRDWQIDIDKLADFLENGCAARGGKLYNRQTGRRVAALMPVHLLGDLCDIDEIAALAVRYDLPLIEDAAECVGAAYKGRSFAGLPAGMDPRRHVVCTSFNGNKIVTTGGGGAVLTHDPELARRARHLSTTAKTRSLEFFHDEVGFNYRLTNLAAAMGVAQLERLAEFVALKRVTAAAYDRLFKSDERIVRHPRSLYGDPIYWLYTVMVAEPALPVVAKLNAAGIQSRPVWTPIWDLPAFSNSVMVHSCDFARRFHRHALSLPSSVSIRQEEIELSAGELLRQIDQL